MVRMAGAIRRHWRQTVCRFTDGHCYAAQDDNSVVTFYWQCIYCGKRWD